MKNGIILMVAIFQIFVYAQAQKVNEWRGKNRAGIFEGKQLLTQWPESGPSLLWFFEGIGNGFGSPTITSDRIYITGEIDSTGFLFSFDLNGKLLWKKEYDTEWTKSFPGSRSCPTVVDKLVYLTSGFGNLYCFDAVTGEKNWSVDLRRDFDGQYTLHGHSEAPLVEGNMVFLVPGGKENNVVALDRFNGKLIWSCKGLGERPGYNAPNLIRLSKRNILVTFSAYALQGIDTKTGELLWTHIQDNVPDEKKEPGNGDTHSNTILYDNGFIYYVAGDGNCAVKLKLSEDGTRISQEWRNKDFDDYMGGFIKFGDFIYGGTTAKKSLVAVNEKTGELTDSLKIGSGNTIAADGMLYYYNQSGKVHLVKPDNGKIQVISSFKITKGTKEHFSQPVIDRGKLYIRHGNTLMVYKIDA
jgi:outer membrane protein assembly factor BamB